MTSAGTRPWTGPIRSTGGYTIGGAALAVDLLSACTENQAPTTADTHQMPVSSSSGPSAGSSWNPTTTSAAPRIASISSTSCPDVSGFDWATPVVLSLGPFTANLLAPQASDLSARKIWISSQRDGHDDALLVVTDPEGRQSRQTHRSGVAQAGGVKQFYPGDIQVILTGLYRIEVAVGPDKMCVMVNYHT